MKVEEAKYSTAELVDWFKSKILIVNKEYQRGSGLWPNAAKSYFIDTILRDYPFAKEYSGMYFSDLDEESQNLFWAYTISVDVIRNANRSEILQMFRRMNAYTLPLKEAEKRHSEFFGEFKDWVNRVLDSYGSLLVDWKVYTSRQIVRMADAEFITDLALALNEGVVSTSPSKLRTLYEENDDNFNRLEEFQEKLTGALETTIENFSELQGTHAMKPHVFHSFICALIHNKYGLPGYEETIKIEPIGEFFIDRETAVAAMNTLASAHEEKDEGKYGEYVRAASEGGNRAAQRATRIRWICKALRGEI